MWKNLFVQCSHISRCAHSDLHFGLGSTREIANVYAYSRIFLGLSRGDYIDKVTGSTAQRCYRNATNNDKHNGQPPSAGAGSQTCPPHARKKEGKNKNRQAEVIKGGTSM